MGREQSGGRKQIYLCIAMLILLGPLGCTLGKMTSTTTVHETALDTAGDETGKQTARDENGKQTKAGIFDSIAVAMGGGEARTHLDSGKKFLAGGDYGKALKEYEKALSLGGKSAAAEESLFYIGLIYAHPSYPARDYGKSSATLKRLMNDYPGGARAEQTKTILGLIQENDKLRGLIDRSNSTIERLNNVIDELKKVDIDVDQKKRERAK